MQKGSRGGSARRALSTSPKRITALEVVLRKMAQCGIGAAINLRVIDPAGYGTSTKCPEMVRILDWAPGPLTQTL